MKITHTYPCRFSFCHTTCSQLYIGAFSAGFGAVPWVIMSEVTETCRIFSKVWQITSYQFSTELKTSVILQIFPINIKGAAGGLATLVNWFGAWAISYTFNFLLSWSSYGE